jgi:anamorsin
VKANFILVAADIVDLVFLNESIDMSNIVQVTDSGREALFDAVAAASPGGHVQVKHVPSSDTGAVQMRMALVGLLNVRQLESDPTALVGDVPNHALGAKTTLADAWKAAAQAAQSGEALSNGELVDEDELLARDGIAPGAAVDGKGCAVDESGKRKPCKDCSCGLADADADAAMPVKKAGDGCGSCALGDAFRCAACPYLGLPPFQPGERVELPTSLMTSDI